MSSTNTVYEINNSSADTFPKHLAQLVITATQVVGRAFARALREEIRTGRQAAARQAEQNGGTKESAAKATTSNLKYGITLQESVQILNVDPHLNDPAEIKKIYEHLFAVNDKSKGGSFYLQSKVYCAKERIDEELKARGIKVEEDTETASEPAPENEKSTTSEESQSDSSKNTDRS